MHPAARIIAPNDPDTVEALRKHERASRSIGNSRFIEEGEKITGSRLKISKPGPKPNTRN
jgi:hypothetical protein